MTAVLPFVNVALRTLQSQRPCLQARTVALHPAGSKEVR